MDDFVALAPDRQTAREWFVAISWYPAGGFSRDGWKEKGGDTESSLVTTKSVSPI